MNIRSITLFCHPCWPPDTETFRLAQQSISSVKQAFQGSGYSVQTTRIATPPFPSFIPPAESVQAARQLERMALEHGFDYLSLGPALPAHPESYAQIPALLAATQSTFLGGVMADGQDGIHLSAVKACARVMQTAAPLETNGFANLRFAALANVSPGAPFFPAAYAPLDMPAGQVRYALALESADLAVTAFGGAPDLVTARAKLIAAMEDHAQKLVAVTRNLDVPFDGMDYSLAPFPEERRSLGAALERLGVSKVGWHGSLAAAAFLAEAIDRAKFPRVGFNGLMLPVLEDSTLAKRAAEGVLTIKDMLLYSAVCGTGLDTLPLPGNTSAEQIYPVLLDLAALSQRLRKPLTARLMPMPGKQAGDPIEFDFPYFANSRVLALESGGLDKPLAGDAPFNLYPRH